MIELNQGGTTTCIDSSYDINYNGTALTDIWVCDTTNATCVKVWNKEISLTVYPVTYNSTSLENWFVQSDTYSQGSATYGKFNNVTTGCTCVSYTAGSSITANHQYELSSAYPIEIEQSYSTTNCLNAQICFGSRQWVCMCKCNVFLNCDFDDTVCMTGTTCSIDDTFSTYSSNGGFVLPSGWDDCSCGVPMRLLPSIVKTVIVKDCNGNVLATCSCPINCCYTVNLLN